METILNFISAYLGIILFGTIVNLIFQWLFIRSAIRSGVEAAINNILSNTEFIEEIIEYAEETKSSSGNPEYKK